MTIKEWGILALCAGLLGLAGCSNANLGRVYGIVQLDGQPLPKATVEFQPDTGRASYGITDEYGRYELMFLPNQQGAVVGRHTARVTTYDWDNHPDGTRTELPEQVPARYNIDSELVFEVSRRAQRINLDLQTDG